MNKNIWKLKEDGKLHLSANNSDETFCGKGIEVGGKAHHSTSKINCSHCLKIVRVSMIYALTQIKIGNT